MRKIYSFIVAAVAILATAACTQELENVAPEATGETVVYTASMDDVASKALLNETTNKPEWEANDAITVHDGTKGWTFTTATAGDNVEFSNSEGFGSYRPVLAVYPAGEYNTVDVANKSVKANIPTYQQAKVNTYNSAAALAVAYTESNSFAFKNAHALLKFTVNTDNVTHVVFHGNNAEALTGDVNVTLGDEGVETVECLETVFTSEQWNEELQQNETVSETKYGTWVECYAYQDEANKYFVKGETYYIVVAPQTFNGGVTVKFRIDEGDELTVKTTTNKVETKASVILDLGELGGVEYTAPATVETVYLKPDVWVAADAWFNAHFFNPVGGVIDVKMDGPDADGMYSATVPENVDKVIFCRMNPEYSEFGWDVWEGEDEVENHVWNQTGDLTIPLEGDDKFYYVISDWEVGEWKNYEDATYVAPEFVPQAGYIYLQPSTEWEADGARFAAYFFSQTWVDMTLVEGQQNIYQCAIPENEVDVIFCRMNPATTENRWNSETDTDETKPLWGQTDDLKMTDGSLYIVSGWDSGSWSGDPAVTEPEQPEVTPGETSEWALVGVFSEWVDQPFITTTEANVVVLENVTMEAAQGFLVRKPSTEWADKYGAGNINYLKANHYITTNKDGVDMCLEAAGTYDIYFNVETKAIYVMENGTNYTEATEQTVSGSEPEQEEPEVTEKKLYLTPNENWKKDGARFAAYFFGVSEIWVSMTDSDSDGVYEVNIPTGYDYGTGNVIFCRMNGSTTSNNWTNKWNQTSDLAIPNDGTNHYTVTEGTWDKGGGTWSTK